MSFCFILNAQSVDKKKRATRVSKGKSKTEVVKTADEKVKSLTSSRVAKGQTKKTKTATKVRSKKAKPAGKLGVSKRVSTKSANTVSVGKEKPVPVKEKAKKNLLTDVKEEK
tara:strand:+ start:242 stop:577 length:336 start_codon:yes stop_codon:yes gene_type:complete